MVLVDTQGFRRDGWNRPDPDSPLPETGRVLIPLERLEEALAAEGAWELGLDLANDAEVEALAGAFERLSLISIAFPSFADGRGFSLARRLRNAGFRGTLRARGHLIADQFAFARACGFDEVEISEDLARRQPEEQWLAAARSEVPGYQRGYGESILDRRRARAVAR